MYIVSSFSSKDPSQEFFEVMGEEVVQEREAEPDIWAKVQKITAERLEHIEKKAKEKVEEADENAEPNPWLKRVGWVQTFEREEPRTIASSR